MKSIKFPGCDLEIGKGQPQYTVLHAMRVPGPEGEVLMCFELTDDEIDRIKETKRIYYRRLTFGGPFQPMNLMVDLSDGIDLKP